MSWGNNDSLKRMETVHTWEKADRLFTSKPLRTRSSVWAAIPDCRPLTYNLRDKHLYVKRVKRGDAVDYELYLYKTPIIRYEQPEGNKRRVLLGYDGAYYRSTTTQSYLHAHGWGCGTRLPADDGTTRFLVPSGYVTLSFVDGKLRLGTSVNGKWLTRYTLPDRIAERKALREKYWGICMTAALAESTVRPKYWLPKHIDEGHCIEIRHHEVHGGELDDTVMVGLMQRLVELRGGIARSDATLMAKYLMERLMDAVYPLENGKHLHVGWPLKLPSVLCMTRLDPYEADRVTNHTEKE